MTRTTGEPGRGLPATVFRVKVYELRFTAVSAAAAFKLQRPDSVFKFPRARADGGRRRGGRPGPGRRRGGLGVPEFKFDSGS